MYVIRARGPWLQGKGRTRDIGHKVMSVNVNMILFKVVKFRVTDWASHVIRFVNFM